ncbi:MAG: right-handed parallel beta-helix repeat-containing protein [Promethearchaeota archaeon]
MVRPAAKFDLGRLCDSAIHPPIYIDGDAALLAFPNKTCGDGSSWAQAVIIENLEIDGNASASPIEIRNTALYLVIRNCTLYNSSNTGSATGIVLYNCSNVNVTNCSLTCNQHGVFCSMSSNTIVNNSNFVNNSGDGIYYYKVSGGSILNNTLDQSQLNGIILSDTNQTTVRGNRIMNSTGNGLVVTGASNDCLVYLNSFTNNKLYPILNSATGSGIKLTNMEFGNYYGDYEEKYPTAKNNWTVWDTPYLLDGGQQDASPIVHKWMIYLQYISPLNFNSDVSLDAYCAGKGTDGLTLGTAHVLEYLRIDDVQPLIILSNITRYVTI